MSPDRLQSFVDAVLAIVITILVLGIELPSQELLRGSWPALLMDLLDQLHPYITSFAMVGAYWVQHNVIFLCVNASNRVFTWLNLLFLLPVTLLPYLTRLRTSDIGAPMAETLYGVTQILSWLLILLLWRYASSGERLIDPNTDPRLVRSIGRLTGLSMVITAVGLAVSFVNVHLGSVVYACVVLAHISPRFFKLHGMEEKNAG